MSTVGVSAFEPENEPLREAVRALDVEPLKPIVQKASDDLYNHLFDAVSDWLLGNLEDRVTDAARRLAERYLGEALAGDDEKLRRLFGTWYHPRDPDAWTLLDGHFPDHWALLRALVERFPDLLRTEALTTYEKEVAALRDRNGRLQQEIDDLRSRL